MTKESRGLKENDENVFSHCFYRRLKKLLGGEKMKKVIYIVGIIALISAMLITPAVAQTLTCSYDMCVNETGWWRDGGEFHAVTPSLWTNLDTGAMNNVNDGDTVFVYNGIYQMANGLKFIEPNVTLIGEDADSVTLDGLGNYFIAMGGVNVGDACPGSVLDGFTVVNSGVGVQVHSNAPNCIIRNCVFDGMTSNMHLSADNLTFENNVVSNCTKYTVMYIGRYGANFCTIANNSFMDNTAKSTIYIRESSNCVVVNNTITNTTAMTGGTGDAIRLYKTTAANNIITRNNISSNGGIIYLKDAGEGNKIYLNDFVDNPAGVTYYGTPPTTTYWNSTEQIEYVYGGSPYTNYLGNNWSDYAGEDTTPHDGIGDTAYAIPGSGTDKDYRPLMEPFGNYPAPVPAQPDLTPTAITLPELLLLNKSSTINASIANIGTDDAGSFNVSLSADGTVVDTVSIESLGAGNSTNVSFQWTPASAGDYELCVVADSDNSIDEQSEANNEICTGVTVLAPDLVPTAITTPTLFVDQPGTITATIENTGTDDAGSFNVSLSANGNVVDTATVDSLNAGTSTNVSFEWTPASAGDIELCVLADCDGSINEVNETNNEMCIDVEIKPDLTTTEITTAALLLLNQSSVVNASIANVGTADAGSFKVSLSCRGDCSGYRKR